MSRTPKRGKPPGYEFWGRRRGRGERGRYGKHLAARGDRIEAQAIIRKERAQ